MKFIYCGYDFAYDALLSLLEDGHELVAVYSFPCDNQFSFNVRLKELAQNLDVPFSETRPLEQDFHNHIDRDGVDLFLALGYAYKLPVVGEGMAYSVNIHPSLLPRARGIMPLPHIIMNDPDAAGITAHKLAHEIDSGDILQQTPISLIDGETIETLSSRIAMRMPLFVLNLINNLPDLWRDAQPQNSEDATSAVIPDNDLRMLRWDDTVEMIMARVRAFGGMGVLFSLNEEPWIAGRVHAWEMPHEQEIGELCYLSATDIVVAISDGYVCISEASTVQPS